MASKAASSTEDKAADADTSADDAPAKPKTIAIELNRSLHGWGSVGERIEVDHTDEVDGLIGNELATKIAKSDLPGESNGLMAPPPVSEAATAAADNAGTV